MSALFANPRKSMPYYKKKLRMRRRSFHFDLPSGLPFFDLYRLSGCSYPQERALV